MIFTPCSSCYSSLKPFNLELPVSCTSHLDQKKTCYSDLLTDLLRESCYSASCVPCNDNGCPLNHLETKLFPLAGLVPVVSGLELSELLSHTGVWVIRMIRENKTTNNITITILINWLELLYTT